MPLLFKNGKLIINDIDQLVFSDDPDSCRCCPGLCECPSGSDYAVPKYVEDVSFSFSNVQDTYSEEINLDQTVQWSDGFVDRFIIERSFQISGLSALNGTYPYSLKTSADLDVDCIQLDPLPICAFDTNNSCVWSRRNPTVPITGIYSNRQYLRRNGVVQFDVNETLYVTGWAVGFPSRLDAGLGTKAVIHVFCCLRNGSYSGDPIGVINIFFTWVFDSNNIIELISVNSFRIVSTNRDRIDCQKIEASTEFFSFTPIFPSSFLSGFINRGGDQLVICGNEPNFLSPLVSTIWCNDNTLPNTAYSIDGCQGGDNLTNSAPPPVDGNGRGFNATLTSSYNLSGYAFDSDWNYTLDPP